MRLSPKDLDKLMLHQAGFVAQKRYARGIRLNYPEAVALISAQLLELIREGYSVSKLMNLGKQILSIADVMPGVASLMDEVQVEGTFPDGTKLVTVHHPVCNDVLDNNLALYGSGLTKSAEKLEIDNISNESPGQKILQDTPIVLNEGRISLTLLVLNSGDRPVQVGSHYPFAETNKALVFDRALALNYRLDIPAGTAVRFEPGEQKEVHLVDMAGEQKILGGNNLINGVVDETNTPEILDKMKSHGYIT
ncbi:urease subunit gamma [Reichenbachiella versicolor]|uniref:urease subunit gamma n=1 Tax=Reichenbachiella versicolor TaxID=1821036 RepID=UPI000D6E6206|nr:urease subunit gamma [Reichenbachiella versicolor]